MKLSYVKGIDSIRSIGIVLVVVYHFYTNVLPGGFFGVDMFFVISGFLVTSLLIREYRESGKIDLIKFYVKRVRRLVPTIAFMVVITLALSLLIPNDLRLGMREQTAAVFGWVTNYYEIMMGASYEDQFIPHLFVHTWMVGMEMQYYLIWGLVLTVFYLIYRRYSSRILELNRLIYGMNRKIFSDRSIVFLVCVVLALITYIRMQLLFRGLDDPSPVYYATFTRFYPLMIGSAFGALVGMRAPKKPLPVFVTLPALVLSVLAVVRMSFVFSFSDPATYRFGILIVSLLTVISLVCLLSLQSRKFFRDPAPLVYLGGRSYGIYLFHWPLYHIFRQMSLNGIWPFPLNTPHYVYTICALAAAVVLAEISFRVFEQPKKRLAEKPALQEAPGGMAGQQAGSGGMAGQSQQAAGASAVPAAEKATEQYKADAPEYDGAALRRKSRRLGRAVAIVFCACTILSAFALITVPPRTNTEADYMHQKALNNISKMEQYNTFLAGLQMSPVALHGRDELLPPTPSELEAALDPESDLAQSLQNALNAYNRADPAGPVQPIAPPGGANVTVIGDSVTLGAAEIIIQTLGSVVVDAEVSRTMLSAPEMIRDLSDKGELGEYIVLALFTNPLPHMIAAAEEAIDAVPPGHRVIVVTPFGKDYMEPTADYVRTIPWKFDFVTVADWNVAIRDNTHLLAGDGLHMGCDDARQIYANLLAQAIDQASRKPAKR